MGKFNYTQRFLQFSFEWCPVLNIIKNNLISDYFPIILFSIFFCPLSNLHSNKYYPVPSPPHYINQQQYCHIEESEKYYILLCETLPEKCLLILIDFSSNFHSWKIRRKCMKNTQHLVMAWNINIKKKKVIFEKNQKKTKKKNDSQLGSF